MTMAVLGEALIDFIMGEDGTYRPHLGGSPYNVAVGLARQGIEVSYLSPLSNDRFGEQFQTALSHEGVAMPVRRRSLYPSSLALVTLDQGGQPGYSLYRQGVADKDICLDEIVANLPQDLQLLHTGSLAITPSQLPKIQSLFELLRGRGVLISIDINIRLGASLDSQAYIQGVRSLVGSVDMVKASDEDLQALGLNDHPRKSAVQLFREMGSGLLVLTEGRHGAVLYGDQAPIEQAAYTVGELKDTVGAGDSFQAAFLAELNRIGVLSGGLSNADPARLAGALDFACAAAAVNVSRRGCSPPFYNEVLNFAARAPGQTPRT